MNATNEVYQLEVSTSGVEQELKRVGAGFDHLGDRAQQAFAKAQAAMDRQARAYSVIPPSIDKVASAFDRLRGRIDPVVAAQQRAEREMLASMGVINSAVKFGVVTEAEATATIARLKSKQIDDINRVRDAQLQANQARSAAANDNMALAGGGAGYRRQNLGFQLQDVGVSLYSGMPITTVLVQQGAQIAGLYGGAGGVNAAMKDFAAILGTAVRYAGPFVAAGAAIYGAYKLVASYGVEASLAIDSATVALAAQAAPVDSIAGRVSELQQITDLYARSVRGTAKDQSIASASIIANSRAEFDAKRALLEIELKRQRAAIAVQQAELATTGYQLKRDLSQQAFTRPDYEGQVLADSRIGSVPFVRLPDRVTGLEKTQGLIDNNPLNDKLKEMRANLTLTEIAAKGLEEALMVTFDESVATSAGRIAKETKAGANAFRDLVKSADDRINQLKTEISLVGMTGAAAAALRYEQELLNSATDKGRKIDEEHIEVLRRKAQEYGEQVELYARRKLQDDITFERDQLFRSPIDQRIASAQRGAGLDVDLNSAEAQYMRLTDRIREAQDAAMGFARTFVDGLLQGKSVVESLTAAAGDLAESLTGDVFTIDLEQRSEPCPHS